MKVKCEVNGKKLTDYIEGKLDNAEKSIEISRYEDIPNVDWTAVLII